MNSPETASVAELQSRFAQLRRFLDEPALRRRLTELEGQMSAPEFWSDRNAARGVMSEASGIKGKLEAFDAIGRRLADLPVLEEMAREDGGAEADAEFRKEVAEAAKALGELELRLLLGDPNDRLDAICSINAGAGGTESCDWASMLLRMYQRWAERRGFKIEMIDMLEGEGAGIKNCTFVVRGELAFGYIKCERGVHRLVRISPFDSNARRHTSFASLDVIAEIQDDIEIEIADKDIRVDVYRAGGPGGQGVNTTDSAVRITHIPTGMIVTCQNERSQIKNRATAMKILKARLYELEMDKKRAEMEKYYGEKGQIGWGRQIRSYVLQPYQMVKDLRTGEQTSDTQGVLDGDIDAFIEAKLRGKKRTDADDADLE
ncbi:MAG TPA: peptide chain release factor 2 [Verrucomicrobiae bacterium]|nr:peptide chain release factor 2 [Verrucomicrobiae bacterium]